MKNFFVHSFCLLLASHVISCAGQGPIVEIQAVVHDTAHLPCNIKPPIKEDTAILVVWYRNEMDAIYSYDSRGKLSEKGSHWKNSTVVGNRAFFRTLEEPAILTMDEVQAADEGMYRCRVDFRKSPTKNNKIKLSVIIPPDEPVIFDQSGKKISSVAGPYDEETDVKLLCKVHGGRPLPMVKWFRGELLLTSSSTIGDEDDMIENELIIRNVSRSHLKSVYSCQANNNNITVPKSTSVSLDVYLRPLEVSILSSRQALSADRKYEIVCQSIGSRPPAKITWFKDDKRLTNFTVEVSADGNVTTSTLTIVPKLDDHNKTLVCRATNEKIKTGVGKDRWKLDISFVPVAKLEFGSLLLNPDDIVEGDDVYFQCSVHANPRAYKIVWKHNGFVVQNDPKSGVITNYDKLILRAVYKEQAGNYSCFASNVEGDGESNIITLKIMYKPVCKPGQNVTYGIAQSKSANVSCEVDAFPVASTFRWSFGNQSSEVSEGTYRMVQKIRNLSVLTVKPIVNSDYGILICTASNAIGQQLEPCVFQIVPAGRPEQLTNCTITNQTTESVTVSCTPGYDGGQTAVFVLEMYDEESGQLLKNITSASPVFFAEGLSSVTSVTMNLYAENVQGRSPALALRGFTLNAAEKRTGVQSSMNLTPYVALLLGLTAFCTLSTIVVLGAIKAHAASGTSPQRYTTTILKKKELNRPQTKVLKLDTIDEDENNPDIIPTAKSVKNQYDTIIHVESSDNELRNESSSIFDYCKSSSCSSSGNCLLENENTLQVVHLPSRNTPIGNGAVHGKQRHIKHHQSENLQADAEDQITAKEIMESVSKDLCRINSIRDKKDQYVGKSDQKKNVKDFDSGSTQKLFDQTIRAEIARSPSQKEIVTVRTPLMSNERESCV